MARPQSDLHLFVFVCILCVEHVCVLEAGLLMSAFVFELLVCVEVFIVGNVIIGARGLVSRRCGCVHFLQTPVRVDDLVDPAPEAAHSGVQRRGGRVGAAVAPGDDPSHDPSA